MFQRKKLNIILLGKKFGINRSLNMNEEEILSALKDYFGEDAEIERNESVVCLVLM